MTLTSLYADDLATRLAQVVDTTDLAERWRAGNPATSTPAGERATEPPTAGQLAAATAFLADIVAAIVEAIRRILRNLWAEGWVLGQQSADSVATSAPVDWRDWEPGDADRARDVARRELADFTSAQAGEPARLADTRAGRMARLLAEALDNDWTAGQLAGKLTTALTGTAQALRTAHTELSRAQNEAAYHVYLDAGVADVDVVTMGDSRVCGLCDDLEADNPHPLAAMRDLTLVPAHSMCRCAAFPTHVSAFSASARLEELMRFRMAAVWNSAAVTR
jgi:hypothetical protein